MEGARVMNDKHAAILQRLRYQPQKDAYLFALDAIKQSPLYPFLQRIILFGSCARGEERFDSDVDLLLVFDAEIKNVPDYRRMYRALRVAASSDELYAAETDLKLAIGNAWETSNETIYHCIRKDGICVWERN